ncbi:hypothetical protein AJ79_04832 [Helicocarpus griseus UAMH5409]|uniref:Uncharacterized protein n=1 Tax=Helicocarpus griseus UAMH5409 TaxID=1447875 RepID=A0A2B7XIM0_9EURO|nr:hypothetical protein AJ79_04832 [Helicocarpus griseus UAMH5409]
MEPGSPLNVPALFKNPNKWTSSHLVGLQIEQHEHVDIAAIVGRTHLPMDGDPSFETLAEDFAGPRITDFKSWHNSPFSTIFYYLSDLYHSRPNIFCQNSATAQMYLFDMASSFLTKAHFHENSLFTDVDLPVAIFAGTKDPRGQICSAEEIVPYLLFQAILEHERRSLEVSHNTFVVSMRGATLQFNKGVISRTYAEDLLHRKVPSEPLRLLRSNTYNLLEQDGRRECSKAWLGLVRNLSAESEGATGICVSD